MTLHRFVVVSFLVFVLGLVALYTGVNRVPLRQQGGTHEMHKSSLQVPAASHMKLVAAIPDTSPVANHAG